MNNSYLKKKKLCPGWCASVDWMPACEPKGFASSIQSQGTCLGCGPGPQ